MHRKIAPFYEAQQYSSAGRWTSIGFFTTKAAATEYCKQFNIGVDVAKIKIKKRSFIQ